MTVFFNAHQSLSFAAFTLAQRAMTLALATSLECAFALPWTHPTILPAERFTKSGLSS